MQLPKLFNKRSPSREKSVITPSRDALRVSNYQPRESKPKGFHLFRSKNEPKVVRPQFGNEFRKQRQTRQQLNVAKGALGFLGRHKRKIILFIVGVLVLGVLGGGFYFINTRKIIALEKIVVSGNEQVKSAEIETLLHSYLGKSLLSFSSSEIEAKILKAFPYVKAAYARKILPKELDIEIEERYPILAFVNLSGTYLIDQDGRVILNYDVNVIPALVSDDILVMEGYGDANANYTKERYLSTIQDATERSKVKWEEVPIEDKQAALDNLRQDLLSRADAKLEAHLATLAASQFKDVPEIKSWDAASYNPGDTFNKEKFASLVQMLDFAQRDTQNKFKEILWQSDFSIVYRMQVGPSLILTTNKLLTEQFQNLDTLRSVRDILNLQVVDLRSQVIAVK